MSGRKNEIVKLSMLFISQSSKKDAFVHDQVRLQLFALAYNLGNLLRRLALPKSVKTWSLRTLWEKLIKIGAKVIRHSRYVVFQMAEVRLKIIEIKPYIALS